MGHARATVKDLVVYQADPARNLLLIKGAVPGAKQGVVIVRRAAKG